MRKWIILSVTLFLAILATDLIPDVRGRDAWGWQWEYETPDRWGAVLLLIGCLFTYVAGVTVIRLCYPKRWAVFVWGIIGGIILSYAVVNVRDDAAFLMVTRTVSPVQTGASTIAVQEMSMNGIDQTLRNWPTMMEQAQDQNIIHFTTSPPGQPLLHFWAGELVEGEPWISRPLSQSLRHYQCSDLQIMAYERHELASTGLGLLMPLFAALMIIPIYSTAILLLDNHATALRIAQWSPLIPAIHLFAPTWNTLYPFLSIGAFAFLLWGLKKQLPLAMISAGIVMSFATFLNFSVIPILLLMGLFTLGYGFQARPRLAWHWPLQVGIWFGIGLASIWVIFWAYSAYTPFDLFATSLEQHKTLVKRDYWVWLFMNPYDTFLFIGWGIVWLVFVAWITDIRTIRNREAVSVFQIFSLSLLITMLALNLSGNVQGENGRILMFYAPFLLIVAGGHFFHTRGWDLPLMALQVVTVVVMGAVMAVVPLDLNPPPTEPRQDIADLNTLPPQYTNAIFKSSRYDGEFRLESYRFIPDPTPNQERVTLQLDWLGIQPTERPYQFQVVAAMEIEGYGRFTLPAYRWYPQNGNYLTSCWRASDVIHDVVIIPLAPAPQGVWELELSAIDARTGDSAGKTILLIPYGIDALP